jgi:hypothetical protein
MLTMSSLLTRNSVELRIAVALQDRSVRLVMQLSPKKSPHRRMAITAFLPLAETTVSFALPLCM